MIICCYRLKALADQGFAGFAYRRFLKKKQHTLIDYTFFTANMQPI